MSEAVYPMEFDTPHRGLEWLEYYGAHKVYHPGWDLNKGVGDQDLGDPVVCPVKGKVEYISPEPTWRNNYNSGFGWFVIVYHDAFGVWSRYAHLLEVSVKKGETLGVGDQIGKVGKTGTKYAHLHFEVFNEKMYKIQKDNWRPFSYYPSRKTKQFVMDHYLDGISWIDSLKDKPKWKRDLEDWASQYIKDMPLLLSGDIHSIIALIKRSEEK